MLLMVSLAVAVDVVELFVVAWFWMGNVEGVGEGEGEVRRR